METRFFAPQEIAAYFESHKLENDLRGKETIGMCSIADLLDICEKYKKGNLKISSHLQLQANFQKFNSELVQTGVVSVIDLDQNNLSTALFERDDGMVVNFWAEAANRDISPKRSIRYLTLRITDDATWWSEEVYQEMEAYHISQDA